MNDTSYAWKHAYRAAFCETDHGQIMIRIYEALAVIERGGLELYTGDLSLALSTCGILASHLLGPNPYV